MSALDRNEVLDRIATSLGNIEKSLSSLAEDTKARRDNQEKLMQQMVGFEEAVQEINNNPYGVKTKFSDLFLEYGSVFILGLIVGGTLSQLGTELWKWLIA